MAKKSLWRRIFKTRSEREIKRIEPIAQKIEDLEPTMQAKSDEELRDMTRQFKERLAGGETLDDILPEAFAAAREAGVRTLHQRAFHVQLLGAIVLSQGRISEMFTGEGKTLTSSLAIYLNALEGEGVHVVTVNDYLAKRDLSVMPRTWVISMSSWDLHAVTFSTPWTMMRDVRHIIATSPMVQTMNLVLTTSVTTE